MNQNYPLYGRWTEAMARRDQGTLLILIVAVTILLLLWEFRTLWPKLLPTARNGLLMIYYAVLAVIAGGCLLGR